MRLRGVALAGVCALVSGCSPSAGDDNPSCGPASGTVAQVTDGDTIVLTSGEKIRYLLIDTPESTTEKECFGAEASEFNRSLVQGKTVALRYGPECKDRYDRLLAFVTVDGREVNRLLVERGYACTFFIGPSTAEREDFEALEREAKAAKRGLWATCSPAPC